MGFEGREELLFSGLSRLLYVRREKELKERVCFSLSAGSTMGWVFDEESLR